VIAFRKREAEVVRRARVEIEGGLYHVYNRVASGEPIFFDPEEAVEFIETIRETKRRDGWTGPGMVCDVESLLMRSSA
jgi:hypothetical protein